MNHLRVKNWEQFQHYKDRNPPWIKLHNELLHSRTWVSVPDASKALAVAIMLLASRFENKIPADPDYIKRVAYLSETPDLSVLVKVDFIEIIELDDSCKHTLASASKVLANRTTETETETEREKERAEKQRKPKKTGSRLPADWKPNEELQSWAMTERPDLDLQKVLDSFTDYWIAKTGAQATKLDWDATFRNWVRNEKRNRTAPTGNRAGESAVQRRDREAREALERLA